MRRCTQTLSDRLDRKRRGRESNEAKASLYSNSYTQTLSDRLKRSSTNLFSPIQPNQIIPSIEKADQYLLEKLLTLQDFRGS